ncbi:MAG: Ig-like domain-containing protein, partial [Acidobacteriota bacterium]
MSRTNGALPGSRALYLFLVAWLACSLAAFATPTVEITSPVDGGVTPISEIALSGQAQGVARLRVDGVEVALEDGRFEAGPFTLAEGERAFLIEAEAADGTLLQWVHRVVRDSRAPRLSLIQPRAGAHLKENSVELVGTAIDRHLEALWVDDEPVTVTAGRFRVPLELADGRNTVTLRAIDVAGNETLEKVELEVDRTAPILTLTQADAEETLTNGATFSGPVRLAPRASEGELRVTLNGAPWNPEQPITREGDHTVEMVGVDTAGNETRREVSFTIDRTAPEFEAVAQDGAEVATHELTLEGRVAGAETVEAGGEPVQVDPDGRFRVPVELEEGSQSVALVARDRAGNRSATRITLKSDTVAPVVVITSPADGAIVASSPITITGTATDDDLVEVRLGATTATLDGASFTLAGIALSEGANALTVEAEDGSGNVGSANLSVTLDTVAPTLEVRVDGAPLVDGAAFTGSITPEILATDPHAVTVTATLDGQAYVSGTTIETPGAHSLTVTATDAAGNPAAPVVLAFETHQSPPALLALAPDDNTLTALATVGLTGQWQGADSLTVAGQPVTLLADGQFATDPLTLAEGTNTLTLVATAANGLSTTVNHRIIRDATAPTLTVSAPADGALVSGAAIDVSGTASDAHGYQVVVNGVVAAVSGSAFLARDVPLVEGENVLLIRAEDELGNARELSRTVVSDTAAPVVTFTDPAVSGTIVPGPTIRVEGTAVDPHLDRVTVNGEPATLSGDSWVADVPIPEGESTLSAEAFDTLGHRGEASVAVERDSQAPAVSITEPDEGHATTAASVDVRGTVEDEPGVTVTVNGQAATITAGTFEALAVPLVDGENLLTVRATDPQGNEGVDSRAVVRDNQAPTYESSDPISGALALGAGTVFELTFSEPLADPELVPGANAIRLEAADGAGGWTELSTAIEVTGTELRITPSVALPTQTELQLVLTTGLTDPAGNALANPTILEFTTADHDAPVAPQVTAPPAFLCAAEVTVAGTSEAGARLRITGGAAPVVGQASPTGDFSLSVELLPGLNALAVVASDDGGNDSAPTQVEVVRDCQAPQVVDAQRTGDVFEIVFDEPLATSSVASAVTLATAAGPIAGSVTASGSAATFTPSAALPAEDLLLEVSTAASDLAGNTLAYPFSRWFEQAPGESFFSGTAIDDATGRPLAGVQVVVTATDGVATSLPRPELTTDETGRFVLAVPAGTHDVTFARPGYSPVFRLVTTQAGAGAEVFDPRLTPVEAVDTIAPAGGTVTAASGVSLNVPSGALVASAEIALTAVSGQGLAALLPYGWSPRAATWLRLDPDQALAVPATLSLPVGAPEGTSLTVAELDLATLQWRALGTETVTGGVVSAAISTTGAYAALERDAGVTEPLAGEILPSLPAPSSALVLSADLGFDPELVLPNQRSRVTVIYTTSEEVASGLPLTLEIQEQLELLDGSQRNEAPYRADLVLYRSATGDAASVFWLQPSAAARSLPVRVGSEVVVVETYADEGVRGNVLGPNGGTVVGDQGDTFDVPAGALPEPTAVVLHRRAIADLPLAAPSGVVIDGVVELEVEVPLALPGTLSYALTPAPTGELGVLLGVVEVDGTPRWRAQAALAPTASGWITTDDGLPWPGVTEAGLYAFARYTEPHGAAWGVLTAPSGGAVSGGIVSSPAVEWIQLSDTQGRYVLPLPADGATVTLRAEDPATGNTRESQVTIAAIGEQVELGLPLQIVAPSVVAVTPADGDVGVPLGVEPTIEFSEPVDPATLAAGITLLRDGEPQAITFSLQGNTVRVLPSAALSPETDYTLTVGLVVQDLQGYGLTSQVSVTFQTAVIALPDSIDPRRLRVIEPNPTTGLARVEGLSGAVPGEVTVTVAVSSPAPAFANTPASTPDTQGQVSSTARSGT